MTTEAKAKKPVTVLVPSNKFITGQAAIETAIDKAKKAGESVMISLQIIACSTIKHTAEHGDIRVIRKLLADLPEGMRKVAMATFIDKFGTVRFDEEGEVHYDKSRKLNLAEAVRTAWWKTAKEAVYVPFNLVQEAQKFYERAVKRFEKQDATKGDDIPVEGLQLLHDAIVSMQVPAVPANTNVKTPKKAA